MSQLPSHTASSFVLWKSALTELLEAEKRLSATTTSFAVGATPFSDDLYVRVRQLREQEKQLFTAAMTSLRLKPSASHD